jgi:hypothetical protein
MLFEFINDILYKKTGKLLDDAEAESELQPFLLQRWLSFYSGDLAKLLNCTTNTLYKTYDDKKMWYRIFMSIVPTNRFRKIKYLKRPKKDNKVDNIEYLAKNMEVSSRELRDIVETFDIDTTI